MRRAPMTAALIALVLSASAAAAAAPAPRAMGNGEVTALSVVPAGGRSEVVIAIGGDVDVRDFTLTTPDRVVMDLYGATLNMPARLYDKVARGAITNIRVAQYREDVVRLVVDLDRARTYTVTRTESEIRIVIDDESQSFAAWHGAAGVATALAAGAIEQPAPRRGDAPRRTSAPQTSRSAVGTQREVRNAAPVADEPRITVTYTESDIRDVIAAFATFSGRTIIVGRGVGGVVSAEVRDQPWDVALRAILNSQGLAAREDQDGIITVDSYENIAKQQATEPVTTQIIPVNYARAGALIETVRNLLSRSCAPGAGGGENLAQCTVRGNVTADSATNRLIVTDVPSRIQEIATYVRELDIRTPQVAIKAKIIFVNRTSIEDLGIAYDLGSRDQFFNRLVQRPDPSSFRPIDTDGDGVPDRLGGGTPLPANQPRVSLGGNAIAAIANANQRVVQPALEVIFATALGRFDLTAFIDALQEVRLADLQAEPSIVTLDNRRAQILVGEETPIRIIDAGGAATGPGGAQQAPRATVSFKETGIILEVTPSVTANRQILMTLRSERSNLQPAASDLGYTFQKQQAVNQLLVADGETAVIGGLTVTQVSQSKAGIPLLVDLPIIGRLFGQTRTVEEKRDLLILVTPHIIDEGDRVGLPPGGGR